MERTTARKQVSGDSASRRVFLRNLTALGAAGGTGALLADHAQANPLRLAQTEAPKAKPASSACSS